MSLSSPDLFFVPTKSLAFDIHKPLLSWIFLTEEFKQWLLPSCAWQLSIIGGPGSGKTTLSILTTSLLRDTFKDQNILVASIFLIDTCSHDHQVLVYYILLDIWRQLSAFVRTKHAKAEPPSHDHNQHESSPSDLGTLRNAIYTKLAGLERAFLVLDDVDLFDQNQHRSIEAELSELRRRGMNVMTTSRLSTWHKAQFAACDNPLAHEDLAISRLFWCCTCQDGAEEIPTICQSCMDHGYKCPHCGQTTNMYEPYDHVDLSIQCEEDVMADYVAMSLELVHGDLGLESSASEKPPLSRLGRALTTSQDEAATTARQVRDKIVRDSDGNIAMAKIRLEACEEAKSVEEVVRYGDRLPGAIVALFDAGIAKIQTMSADMVELGLKAIVGVATEFHDEPFEDLERWLRRQVKSEWLPRDTSTMPDTTIEKVLRAAAGFLVVDNSVDRLVTLYHGALGYYATERYNESLFWIHTSINTMNRLETDPYIGEDSELKRPMRTQTWHPTARRLAYTRTA